jgi:hypothetical protein
MPSWRFAGMRPLTDTANLILELVRRSLDVGDAEGTLYQLELLVERVRSIVSQSRSLLPLQLPSGLQWRHCQCETHPDTYATVGHSGLRTEWESHSFPWLRRNEAFCCQFHASTSHLFITIERLQTLRRLQASNDDVRTPAVQPRTVIGATPIGLSAFLSASTCSPPLSLQPTT